MFCKTMTLATLTNPVKPRFYRETFRRGRLSCFIWTQTFVIKAGIPRVEYEYAYIFLSPLSIRDRKWLRYYRRKSEIKYVRMLEIRRKSVQQSYITCKIWCFRKIIVKYTTALRIKQPYIQCFVLIESIFNNRYYGQYTNYLFLLEINLSSMYYFYNVLIFTIFSFKCIFLIYFFTY